MSPSPPLRAAVFASGSGSNFQALVEAERTGAEGHPWRTVLLVSDRRTAGALDRAEALGVPSRVVEVAGRPQDELSRELLAALEAADVEVLFLAGYLRLVPEPVVDRFRDRILNIHPALLPAFGGKGMWGRHVHAAVLEAGCRVSGATVHLADEVYDRGLILAQWPVPVLEGDTPESLAARVLEAEHQLYPQAAAHLCRTLQAGEAPHPLDLGGDRFIME